MTSKKEWNRINPPVCSISSKTDKIVNITLLGMLRKYVCSQQKI